MKSKRQAIVRPRLIVMAYDKLATHRPNSIKDLDLPARQTKASSKDIHLVYTVTVNEYEVYYSFTSMHAEVYIKLPASQ